VAQQSRTTRKDTVGQKLVDALKNSAGSGPRTVDVEEGGIAVRAKVKGSGPYGSNLDQLSVERPDGELADDGSPVEQQADAIVERVTYLPERLRKHEVEGGLGRGILRSRPEDMRDREYQELDLLEGRKIDVARYKFGVKGGKRKRIPQSFGHENLRRLTDDLAGALEPGEEEEE